MVRIRDPLHGTVVLSDLEERLLDTPQMQRLRGIRQLAMAHRIAPLRPLQSHAQRSVAAHARCLAEGRRQIDAGAEP